MTPEHGSVVAQQHGDLISFLIGAIEWDLCSQDVGAVLLRLLAEVRSVQPDVTVVVVTPLVSWREGRPCTGRVVATPEAMRESVAGVVEQQRVAGDKNLYLVHGKSLVPGAFLSDGVHPNDYGMREVDAP